MTEHIASMSSKLIDSKSCGSTSARTLTCGCPRTSMRYAIATSHAGSSSAATVQRTLTLDDVRATNRTEPLGVDAGHRSALDVTPRDVLVRRRVCELHLATNVVDVRAEQLAERLDRVTEWRRRRDDVVSMSGVTCGASPAELVLV